MFYLLCFIQGIIYIRQFLDSLAFVLLPKTVTTLLNISTESNCETQITQLPWQMVDRGKWQRTVESFGLRGVF